jgi:hypothetical protein
VQRNAQKPPSKICSVSRALTSFGAFMGIDIEGFIEVRHDSENDTLRKWVGLVPVSPFIGCSDADSDILFGISKVSNCECPIAPNRGLPSNTSKEVTDLLDSWKEFEKEDSNFSFDELFGFTHITFKEFNDLKVFTKLEGTQWCTIFKLMDTVNDRFKAENIRLVVWAYY